MKTLALLTGLLTGLAGAAPVYAQDEAPARWVEIEVIVFTRTVADNSLREEFPQQVNPIRFRRTRDLLSQFHYPDIRALFKATGNCSVEQRLQRKAEQIPATFSFSPEYVAEEPAIDDAELYAKLHNDIFVEPDVTRIQPPLSKDCYGDPIEPSWSDPVAYISDDKHRDRSFDYHYDMYPRVIIAGESAHNNYVHLMSPRNFKLREIYRTLRRQPDIRPILHTAWREPGVAPSYARATRLYGGIDYSEKYDFQGNPLDEQVFGEQEASLTVQDPNAVSALKTVTLVDNIERVLSMVDQGATINYKTQKITSPQGVLNNNKRPDPSQVIEVDGLMKIYIDPRNYLHIDAEFNVRREALPTPSTGSSSLEALLATHKPKADGETITDTPILNNYHFKQTRRVVTKQLHYFDHPYMGMIVQIRRYGW